jgi:hypothetical protein
MKMTYRNERTEMSSANDDDDTVSTQSAAEEAASNFACNAVCPHCSFLSYCPMESNHYGAHRCSQGHSF